GPDAPLVIPALNRDGDCLSDLVMPLYGSIAGAESVLLAFDADYEIDAVMCEAPHGTAPGLQGKDVANPMAMILAAGALLHYASERRSNGGGEADPVARRVEHASRAIYESVFEATAGGTRTADLGGHASTTEFTDAVRERVRSKLDTWSAIGSS
ncbi:MAG: isocitrate/isopropylmalate family dehydrogenase, partial [Thermoleophilaceae bacterium]